MLGVGWKSFPGPVRQAHRVSVSRPTSDTKLGGIECTDERNYSWVRTDLMCCIQVLRSMFRLPSLLEQCQESHQVNESRPIR